MECRLTACVKNACRRGRTSSRICWRNTLDVTLVKKCPHARLSHARIHQWRRDAQPLCAASGAMRSRSKVLAMSMAGDSASLRFVLCSWTLRLESVRIRFIWAAGRFSNSMRPCRVVGVCSALRTEKKVCCTHPIYILNMTQSMMTTLTNIIRSSSSPCTS